MQGLGVTGSGVFTAALPTPTPTEEHSSGLEENHWFSMWLLGTAAQLLFGRRAAARLHALTPGLVSLLLAQCSLSLLCRLKGWPGHLPLHPTARK